MMTKSKIQLLNGDDWHLQGAGPKGELLEMNAQVPGHVHLDLEREKIIPEMFWRDNAEKCQWVEHWDWTYSHTFQVEEVFKGKWFVLEFGGLDTFATISLNGEEIGRTANMLIPHRFEVSHLLKPGDNHLMVHFDSIWEHLEGKPLDAPCAFETQERLHIRRMQCTFHWDWVNRFVGSGIWKAVRLLSYDKAKVAHVGIWTDGVSENNASAKVALQVETEHRSADVASLNISLHDPDGVMVASHSQNLENDSGDSKLDLHNLNLSIENPQLWWPNGYGAQPLYRCQVEMVDVSGFTLDVSNTTFGIRTVEVRQECDLPGSVQAEKTKQLRQRFPELEKNGDRPGSSFTLWVNGVEIFCKGANWVPADPFPARISDDHYEHLIKLAADGHQNMLRAWGGGFYESPAFWDACNRHGILVCQDFMTACAQYPEGDVDFMAAMAEEIPSAIKMLRNHPSLAWWYGDNENGMRFSEDDPNCWGKKLFDEIINPACRELDPSRPLFQTSPFGGDMNTSPTIGDCHVAYNPSKEDDFCDGLISYKKDIEAVSGRFLSETQSYGSGSWSSLLKFMTEEDLADPENKILEYHSKTNPYQEMTLIEAQLKRTEMLLGHAKSPQIKVAFLEYIQYEWVRLIVEHLRRDRDYCSGVLFWMYNDCWPANGWSMVDYYGLPKAGWYAMKQASKPIVCSIKKTDQGFQIWACNDSLLATKGTLSICRQGWVGEAKPICRREVEVPANQSSMTLELSTDELQGELSQDEVFICDLQTEQHDSDRAWYFEGLPKDMTPPMTELEVQYGHGEVTIQSKNYARVVTLAGDVVFGDNYFEMLPGECRTIQHSHPEKKVSVSCWNDARK
jgi:beta-mannosidase